MTLMAKMTFNKQDRNKTPKPIEETKISKPKETFDISKATQNTKEKEPSKLGRPRKNKTYGTVRLQKENVNRINSIQNTLGYETQDDLISALLNEAEQKMSSEQKIMFDMYLKAFTKRQKSK